MGEQVGAEVMIYLHPGTNVRLVLGPLLRGEDRAHRGSEVGPRAKRNSEKILFSAAELPPARSIHSLQYIQTCSTYPGQEFQVWVRNIII